MLTISYTDLDGYNRIDQAKNIRCKSDNIGDYVEYVGFINGDGEPCEIEHSGRVFVMNANGSTVASWIVG